MSHEVLELFGRQKLSKRGSGKKYPEVNGHQHDDNIQQKFQNQKWLLSNLSFSKLPPVVGNRFLTPPKHIKVRSEFLRVTQLGQKYRLLKTEIVKNGNFKNSPKIFSGIHGNRNSCKNWNTLGENCSDKNQPLYVIYQSPRAQFLIREKGTPGIG